MAQDNTNQNNQPLLEDTAPAAPPQDNKEAVWQQVDVVYNAARKAYLQGSLLPDVIDSFIATLQEIKNTETQNLGGLGEGKTQINLNESSDEEAPGETPF